MGSIITTSGERRSAHQRLVRTYVRTYVPSYENKRYTDVAGIMNFKLTAHAGVNQKRMMHLNVASLDRLDLQADMMTHVLAVVIIQNFSLKKGLQLQVFGKRGKEPVNSELQQMQDMAVHTPVDAKLLNPEHRNNALPSLIF